MDNSSVSYSSRLKKRMPFSFNRGNVKPQTFIKLIVPVAILFVLSFSIFTLFHNKGKVAGVSDSNQNFTVRPPLEKIDVNKKFNFTLKDANGKDSGTFSYTLETAELTDQIIWNGSRANAVSGREFLILNLKLVNTLDRGIQINSKDYIRLMVNGNAKELLAPDFNNDPVEVQAISTKYSRIGFPINTTDKDLVLQVGEINGKKETIKLSFKDK